MACCAIRKWLRAPMQQVSVRQLKAGSEENQVCRSRSRSSVGSLVERLSDGNCRFTGAMYGGGVGVHGPTAVLKVADTAAHVRIVVSSIRSQCLDLAQFTHFGLDPRNARIICVKSTAHFRADFEPIAETILLAAAPGAFSCDLGRVPYRRLRSGLRLGPCGVPFAGAPA